MMTTLILVAAVLVILALLNHESKGLL